jgi:hypothetical protein
VSLAGPESSVVSAMLLRRAQQWARAAPEGSLAGLLRGCRHVSTTAGCYAQKRGELGGDNKDGEGDGEGKPTRGKREIISDEEVGTHLPHSRPGVNFHPGNSLRNSCNGSLSAAHLLGLGFRGLIITLIGVFDF